MRLKERVAIVTGGARGIGAGIGRCLADEGARVALLDIDGDEAGQVIALDGGSTLRGGG
jgi:NAD(P)-dependent dehydrogenase (short-subunit alcohol dehydrogenase family)